MTEVPWATEEDRRHPAWVSFLGLVDTGEVLGNRDEILWDGYLRGWEAHDWHQNGPK